MSCKSYIQLLCTSLALFIVCCLLINCSNTKSPEQIVIIVKVPPFYDEKFSEYGNHLRFQDFLYPPKDIPKDKIVYPKTGDKQGMPHDHSLLNVLIDEKGEITLNNQNEGTISDTSILTAHLITLFQERAEAGVYETGNWNVVKAVGIETAHSVKYGDFLKVVEAVKQNGAKPIVLMFDDDARPKLIIDKLKSK